MKKNTQVESREQFFANISHEIRTPINAVIGLSHILLEADLKQEHKDYLEKIELSGNHILNLINDILDFSKIEAGKFTLEHIEFNLNDVLKNVAGMLSFKTFEKGLDLIFDIAPDVPAFFMGDALRLSQVIINLMNNAVKFTPTGEIGLRVKLLSTSKGRQKLEFTVFDTGIGLSQEQKEKLFESYTQAESSTAREFGGTGLGLTISKQLVELMGGKIVVESEVEKGSQFIFTIEADRVEKSSYTISDKSMLEKRVLIMDSNPRVEEALSTMLKRYAYDAVHIQSKAQLEEEIALGQFDILCIEKSLLIRHKDVYSGKNMQAKIVVLHSSLDVCSKDKFKNISIASRLVKPFTPRALHRTLYEVFDIEMEHNEDNKKNIAKKDLQALYGSHILLVEDNKINQSLIIALLVDTGIHVSVANNGKEAVEMVTTLDDIDLVLMDIEMPIMNGYEAMETLKKENLLGTIPVIALTGNTQESDIEKTKEYGMVSHLVKPLNINTFYGVLLDYIAPKYNFIERTQEALLEIQALIGVGKHAEVVTIVSTLSKEAEVENHTEILNCLSDIEENILNYKKLFLVMINNYDKNFNIFLETVKLYLNNDTLDETQKEKILFLTEGIEHLEGDKQYRIALETFIDKYRDSVNALRKRTNDLRIEEAIQLAYQIKREALEIKAQFVSQSLEPIVVIENTQRKKLDNVISVFKEVMMKKG